MFASIKNNLKQKKYVKMLTFIVGGTQGAAGKAYVPEAEADVLVGSEPTFVTVNKADKDAAGNVAVSATAAGIAASQSVEQAKAAEAQQPKAPTPTFTLQDGVTLPPVVRGGVKADIYPFGKMGINQSFVVAATEKRPNPAKALASTVSSANKRFKAEGRKFTVRAIKAGVNGETESGARIWRTA